MKCTWHQLARRLWQPTISSFPVIKANSQKRANAWRKIKKSCLHFTTFRPNISRIYGPPTPSNPPSLLADGDNESGIVTVGQNLGLADYSSCSAPALERGVLKLHKAAARGLQCSLLDPTLKRGKLALYAGHFCEVCAAQIFSVSK